MRDDDDDDGEQIMIGVFITAFFLTILMVKLILMIADYFGGFWN